MGDICLVLFSVARKRLLGAWIAESEAAAVCAMKSRPKSFARRLLGPAAPSALFVYNTIIGLVRRLDPGQVTFRNTSGRTRVDHRQFGSAPRLAVILALGASNIANEGDPNGLIAPQSGVYNFNFFDGHCYVAKDPLLGATLSRGNLLTRLGDLLVQRGAYDRVLLIPIAYGGTYAAEWAPSGRMHPRLRRALRLLQRRNITVTHVLWQEGEAEAAMPNPDSGDWARHFFKIAATIRSTFAQAKIYVAQCTICRNAPNEIIRMAQRSVLRTEENILAGPDLDVIGLNQRWDQCHFSTTGLDKAARLWLERLTG